LIETRIKEEPSMLRTRLMGFVVLAAALALPGVARAQEIFWHVNYFDNNVSSAPDAKVRLVNSGAEAPLSIAGGDICALIYVFKADQQIEECCGCLVTPSGLLTLSVGKNLTHNPLHAGGVPSGVVKVVESLPNVPPGTPRPGSSPTCDPATPGIPTTLGFAALGVWGTHSQPFNVSGVPFLITETGDQTFQSVFASADSEPDALALRCLLDIQINGSGFGRCTCPAEGSTVW
jgi:hypothetical protein